MSAAFQDRFGVFSQKFLLASFQDASNINLMVRFLHILLFLFSPLLFAEETPEEENLAQTETQDEKKTTKSPVKQLNDDEYLIGKVHLNKKTREISFPTFVNMDEGLLEYAIVHIQGKVHESLLYTEIKASNLNIAFKLLRYPESNELFEIIDEENYRHTGEFPQPPQATRDGARINIKLSWEHAGEKKSALMNELIYHTTLERPMPSGPWLYTGSYLFENRYKADLDGDIAAIFLAQPAMINYPGDDRMSDEVWIVNKKACPPVGTPVTVTISPFKQKIAEK